jgi:hypothetical protein
MKVIGKNNGKAGYVLEVLAKSAKSGHAFADAANALFDERVVAPRARVDGQVEVLGIVPELEWFRVSRADWLENA